MADDEELSDTLSEHHWLVVWKAAFGQIPNSIHKALGLVFFLIQANLSYWALEYQSFLISNPEYGVLIIGIFTLLLSFLFANSVRIGKKDIESKRQEVGSADSHSTGDNQRPTKQLSLLEANMIADLVEQRMRGGQQDWQKNSNDLESQVRSLREELKQIKEGSASEFESGKDIGALEDKVENIEEEISELRSESVTQFEFQTRLEEIEDEVDSNRENELFLYDQLKKNTDIFESSDKPPEENEDNTKDEEQQYGDEELDFEK